MRLERSRGLAGAPAQGTAFEITDMPKIRLRTLTSGPALLCSSHWRTVSERSCSGVGGFFPGSGGTGVLSICSRKNVLPLLIVEPRAVPSRYMSNPLTKAALWPLLLSSLATPASAQPTSSGITVVASHLDDVLTLSDFDDTAWPLLKPNQLLDDAHLAAFGNGYLWVRLHLHILDAHSPLAIAIGHSDDPYTVYANGQPIASSAGMASHVSQLDYPFTIGLPRAREITVAIRFYHPLALTRLPLQQLQIGPMSEIAASTELTRIHDFDFHRASVFILALALLAFAAFSLILFLAQRQRPEYLWLALYCLCLSGWGLVGIGATIGMISSGRWNLLLLACFGYASLVCSLEFVTRFVRVKAGWPLRLVELTSFLARSRTPFRRMWATSMFSV